MSIEPRNEPQMLRWFRNTNVNDVSRRRAGFQICHMRLILRTLVRPAQTPSEVTGTCKMKGGFEIHCVCQLKRNEASTSLRETQKNSAVVWQPNRNETSTLVRKNQLRGHADTGTSHRIPSHHLTSHHTTSQRNTSHRVASHHVTAHTTHHTAPHHLISSQNPRQNES